MIIREWTTKINRKKEKDDHGEGKVKGGQQSRSRL